MENVGYSIASAQVVRELEMPTQLDILLCITHLRYKQTYHQSFMEVYYK